MHGIHLSTKVGCMFLSFQVMTFALIVITCQAVQSEFWHRVRAEPRTKQKFSDSKLTPLRRKSIDEYTNKNSGAPLDMNNKLQKVKNHEKRPDSQPNKVKSRRGRLVTRSQHLLKVKDFKVASSIDSAEEGSKHFSYVYVFGRIYQVSIYIDYLLRQHHSLYYHIMVIRALKSISNTK